MPTHLPSLERNWVGTRPSISGGSSTNTCDIAPREAGSEPKDLMWYDAGHGFGDDLIRDQVEWLARWIGIDPERFGG